jgi:hypothetical protein
MEGTLRIRLTCSSVRVHGLLGQEAVSLTHHLHILSDGFMRLLGCATHPGFESQRRLLSPTATHVNERQD